MMPASYLLRFDDLCPTMNWGVWREIEEVLSENNVKPLLAVVPDNQDETLKVAPANPDFWEHVRRWQRAGWTIGLHGYQHRYTTREPGIIGLNSFSEFAGLSFAEQESKSRRALDIFQREGVRPEVWIAPGCSFDQTTLAVLKQLGLTIISDGYFLFPHVDPEGMIWVPHQIWRFRRRLLGVWTIGFHHNAWTPGDVAKFRRDVEAYRRSITCLDDVVARYGGRRRTRLDRWFSWWYLRSLRVKSRVLFALRGRP